MHSSSYVFNWGKYQNQIESEICRMETTILALKGQIILKEEDNIPLVTGGLTLDKIKNFKKCSKKEQNEKLEYLEKICNRMKEVKEIADKGKFIGRVGLVTRVDGKTYNALMRITTNYQITNNTYNNK